LVHTLSACLDNGKKSIGAKIRQDVDKLLTFLIFFYPCPACILEDYYDDCQRYDAGVNKMKLRKF
jgi:hypothetical protein